MLNIFREYDWQICNRQYSSTVDMARASVFYHVRVLVYTIVPTPNCYRYCRFIFFHFWNYLLAFTVLVPLPYGSEWIFWISLFIVRYDHFQSVLPVTVDKAYCQYCCSSWILYYFIFKNFDFIFLINVLKILYFYSYIFNFIFWFYIFGYIFLILYFWFYTFDFIIFDFVFSVLYF